MIIRSILTIAVLASFVFGAAANAAQEQTSQGPMSQVDRITAPETDGDFASAGGLGSTR